MSSDTSIQRYSFVATCELICDEQSFSLAEISSEFITLRTAANIPPGPAELIIRYDDRPQVHRHIEIVGPMEDNPLRIAIRRS